MTDLETTGRLATVEPLLDRALVGGVDGRPPHPLFPGAVIGVDDAAGRTLLTRGVTATFRTALHDGDLVSATQRLPVGESTVYDLASLTKLFTTLVILGLAQDGRVALDDRVAVHLPEFRRPSKEPITVRQLLTHTSGLPAVLHLWTSEPDAVRRPAAVLNAEPERAPGSTFVYSCTGFLTLALLAERLTGDRIDVLVRERVCGPLSLADTGHRPLRHGIDRTRIAATEARGDDYFAELGSVLPDIAGEAQAPQDAGRGDLRGVVHDENAASLYGAAGNAGVFGTAGDLLGFGRAVLDGITGRAPLLGLDQGLVDEMVRPQLGDGVENPGYESGLGFRIDDPGFFGTLAGTGRAYGHTGYTGTSLVLDAERDLVVAILTNRVHPSREWSELQPFRRAVHTAIAG